MLEENQIMTLRSLVGWSVALPTTAAVEAVAAAVVLAAAVVVVAAAASACYATWLQRSCTVPGTLKTATQPYAVNRLAP